MFLFPRVNGKMHCIVSSTGRSVTVAQVLWGFVNAPKTCYTYKHARKKERM